VLVIGAGVAGLAAIQPLGLCDDTLSWWMFLFFPTKNWWFFSKTMRNEAKNRSVNDVHVYLLDGFLFRN